jgi:Methyltransferase domain
MKCIICNSKMEFYFSKEFQKYDLEIVNYYQCTFCGFVMSQTHQNMDLKSWKKLNHSYHEEFYTKGHNEANFPPYFEQALMLYLLKNNNVLPNLDWLDYAAGTGTLSKILKSQFNIEVINFDKYLPASTNYLTDLEGRKFKLVINSAMFEHVTKREHLDLLNDCVAQHGNLAIHTVVCEKIPKDPNWFYLLAVHCAFHTNKSMGILMKDWGYKYSIYSPIAKMWILFRDTEMGNGLIKKIDFLNELIGGRQFYIKNGFYDYWK